MAWIVTTEPPGIAGFGRAETGRRGSSGQRTSVHLPSGDTPAVTHGRGAQQ